MLFRYPHFSRACAALAAWIICAPSLTQGADATPAPAVLRVGVADDVPFAIEAAGKWSGLTIDLREAVGRKTGTRIEFVRVDAAAMSRQIAERKIDVGPLVTISAERVQEMDFSLPVLPTGLAIATVPSTRWDVKGFFRQAWDNGTITVIGLILAANGIVGGAIWLIERRRNAATFGGPAGEGIASGIWCSVTTMTTVGYGDKVPVTLVGRVLCFLMMLTGVIVVSLFTASATSVLTASHLRPRVHTKADLKHVTSVAIDGSAAADYLQRNRLPRVVARNFEEAQRILERGEAAAFVHARVELQTQLQRRPGNVLILPLALEEEFYASPLPRDSTLHPWINRVLQAQLDSPEWNTITAAYLRE